MVGILSPPQCVKNLVPGQQFHSSYGCQGALPNSFVSQWFFPLAVSSPSDVDSLIWYNSEPQILQQYPINIDATQSIRV